MGIDVYEYVSGREVTTKAVSEILPPGLDLIAQTFSLKGTLFVSLGTYSCIPLNAGEKES